MKNEKKKQKAKKATYMLTLEQIEQMKKAQQREAVDKAFVLFLGLPVMVIHDYYGKLNKKDGREERFLNLVIEQYYAWRDGYISLDDVRKCLKDECGLEIEVERK